MVEITSLLNRSNGFRGLNTLNPKPKPFNKQVIYVYTFMTKTRLGSTQTLTSC